MTPQCKALTKSGKPCRGRAQAGTEYCGPHQQLARKPVAMVPDDLRQAAERVNADRRKTAAR